MQYVLAEGKALSATGRAGCQRLCIVLCGLWSNRQQRSAYPELQLNVECSLVSASEVARGVLVGRVPFYGTSLGLKLGLVAGLLISCAYNCGSSARTSTGRLTCERDSLFSQNCSHSMTSRWRLIHCRASLL